MYAARLIVVVFLILAIVVGYNPQVREKMGQTWDTMRPFVISLMDNVYAAVRSVIAGNEPHNRTKDPGSPGGNFDRVVTMTESFSL